MSTKNIAEDIFKSISLIVEKRIANLEFDKTIVCTIEDASKAEKQNLYTVTDGSAKFEVQGNGDSYAIGDQVRVVIPRGDFSEKKYIQGKYNADDTTKPITYVSPLGSVLKVTDNLFKPEEKSILGIAANNNIWQYDNEDKASLISNNIGNNTEILLGTLMFDDDFRNSSLYDTIYLGAEFQTNFDQYDMVNGDYGLHILIAIEKQDPEEKTKIINDRMDLYFSAKKNMFGNPYAFHIFTQQEIKYDFSDWLQHAIGAQIYLYQSNDFKYLNQLGKEEYYKPEKMDELYISDIKVQNIQFGFGSEITNVEFTNLKLYTNDSTNFRSNDEIIDNRTLQLLWYNKSENNEYIGFGDGRWSSIKDFEPETDKDETIYYYDEEEYLAKTAANSRLLARRCNAYHDDELSLSLAADVFDIRNYCNDLSTLIGAELNDILYSFYKYTIGIAWEKNPFHTLLGNAEGSIGAYAKNAQKYGEILFSLYDKILSWPKLNASGVEELSDKIILPNAEELTLNDAFNYHETLIKLIDELKKIIAPTNQDNLENIEDAQQSLSLYDTIYLMIHDFYPSYQSVYDTYLARWNAVEKSLSSLQKKFEELMKVRFEEETHEISSIQNIESLKTIQAQGKEILNIIAYIDQTTTEEFKSKYDNKYCLYWYRYDKYYDGQDIFMPPHWERLTSFTNYGLPGESTDKPGYLKPKTNLKDLNATVELTLRERQEEKFAVVLFQNHTKFVSNELIFNNLYNVPDRTAIDANGALQIEHNNSSSQNSYQLYGSNGLLLNAADAQTKRELRARFNGETGGDEQLVGATIYWYVPNNATMLEVFDSDIRQSDFRSDRIVYYKNEEELSAAYDSGKITNTFTNVMGPIKGAYYFCNLTNEYKEYVNNTDYIFYKYNNFTEICTQPTNNLDTNKKYIVKEINKIINIETNKEEDAYIIYKIYTYNNNAWVTVKESGTENDLIFNKFERNNAHANIYDSIDDINADSQSTLVECLIGPNNDGPYTYYEYYSYDNEQEEWVATGNIVKDIASTLMDVDIYKPGYHCYIKTVNYQIDNDGNALKDENDNYIPVIADTVFPYHIKNYYQYTSTQNSILCIVKKNGQIYQSAKHFSFTSYGNNGTDYTLALLPNVEYPMVTSDNALYVSATLYDYEDNEIPLPENTKFEWWGKSSGYKEPIPELSNNNLIGCTIERETNSSNYAGILKCSISSVTIENLNNKKINLVSYLSIPYAINQNLYIEGASSIIYDSNGSNPQYYKKAYTLYDKQTNISRDKVSWSIVYYNMNSGTEITDSNMLKYLPTLDQNNTLIPSVMYLHDNTIQPVVIATDDDTEDILWAQPILISQNTHSSSVVNEWDGSLTINDNEGTILSTMVGAGRKNANNEFEGVLMGDVATGAKDNSIVEPGLYGFHGGAQSFGFKIDGTAFLGKSSGGRISFNGNDGYIYSQEWLRSFDIVNEDGTITPGSPFDDNGKPNRGTAGMLIDLQKGTIDAYNFKLTAGNFALSNSHLSPTSNSTDINSLRYWYGDDESTNDKGVIIFKSNNDQFAITDQGQFFAQAGKIANWNIGNSYLITDNTLGLTNSFHMYSDGTGEGKISEIEKANWMLGIGSHFGVDSIGNIYASGGQIGSLEITSEGLSSQYIDISKNTVVFKTSGRMELQGDDGKTANVSFYTAAEPEDGDEKGAVTIATTGERPFVIKNDGGAGIKFLEYQKEQSSVRDITITQTHSTETGGADGTLLYRARYPFSIADGKTLSEDLQLSFYCHLYFSGNIATFWIPTTVKGLLKITIPKATNSGLCYLNSFEPNPDTYNAPIHTDAEDKPTILYLGNLIKPEINALSWNDTSWVQGGDGLKHSEIGFIETNNILYSLGSFCPIGDTQTLGDDNSPWLDVVTAPSGSRQGSDIRLKNSISTNLEKYNLFFDLIQPSTFYLNAGTSHRLHCGFIAQQIESSLYNANLSTLDFAGLCKSSVNNGTYTLRYSEFIPLNTWQIQKLKPRMTEAEERIYKLEQELQKLKSKLI